MFVLPLSIVASLAPPMLGAAAVPPPDSYDVEFNRAEAVAALSTALGGPGIGRVSFTVQEPGIARRPIAVTCDAEPGRVSGHHPTSRQRVVEIVCRFSEGGRWLPARLDLQMLVTRGPTGKGATLGHGKLTCRGQQIAVVAASGVAGRAPHQAAPNTFLFTIGETQAASVAIGDAASVRIAHRAGKSATRGIMLAASVLTVLSPSAS